MQNGTQILDTRAEWPCGGQPRHGDDLSIINNTAQCFVCIGDNPCLFDLLADAEERKNLAHNYPSVVATMRAKLASFKAYVHGDMSPHDLQA